MITVTKTDAGYSANIDGDQLDFSKPTVESCLNDAYERVSNPVEHFIDFVRDRFLDEDQIVPSDGYQSTDLVYYSNSTEFYKLHRIPLWELLEETGSPLQYLIDNAGVDVNDHDDFMHSVATCGLNLAFMMIESEQDNDLQELSYR